MSLIQNPYFEEREAEITHPLNDDKRLAFLGPRGIVMNPMAERGVAYEFELIRETWHMCREYGVEPDVFADLGAHVGVWSVCFSDYFRSVNAYEPQAELEACLRLNAQQNGAKNITTHAKAFHPDFPETVEFQVAEEGDRMGNMRAVLSDRRRQLVEVPVITRAEMRGIARSNLIKIDLEGLDAWCVRALVSREAQADWKPKVIVFEMEHDYYHRAKQDFELRDILGQTGLMVLLSESGFDLWPYKRSLICARG